MRYSNVDDVPVCSFHASLLPLINDGNSDDIATKIVNMLGALLDAQLPRAAEERDSRK